MSKVKFGWLKDYAGTKFLPKTLAKLIYNDDGTTILDTFTKVEQETDKKVEDLTSNVNSQFQSVNESIDGINDSIDNINETIEDINEFNNNVNATIDGKITTHNTDENAHGLKDKFSDFESADKTNAESIASHINNKNNPHEVTAEQIDAIHKSVINAPGGVVGLDNDGNIEVNNITTQGEAFYFTDKDGNVAVAIDDNGLKTAHTTIRNTLTIGDTSLTEEEAKKLKDNTYTKDEVYNKEQVYNKEEVDDIKQTCTTEINTEIANHNKSDNAHSEIIQNITTKLDEKANVSDVYTKEQVDGLIPKIPDFPSVNDINELIETHNKETNAHSEIVSTINAELEKKLYASEVVAEATPNKVLKLNDGGKLPASITGDADTLDEYHANDFVLKEAFEEYEENNNNAHTTINNSIQSLNSEIETLKKEGLKGAALEELKEELTANINSAIESHNTDTNNTAHQNIRSDIQDLSGTLSSHINNKENPHGVTAEQIEAVPIARTVNGHALNEDITLTYADVEAEPSGAINTHNIDDKAHGIDKINSSIQTLTTNIVDINKDIEDINKDISTKLEKSEFNDFKGDFESVEAAITEHDTNENAHSIIINAINATLETKANSENVYNKTEIADLLANKADKSKTYNKENEEVENLIASHESDDTAHGINSIVANLNSKANSSDVYDKDAANNKFVDKEHLSLFGDGNNHGHVKLSDATNSDSDASKNIAATPKAIKDVVTSLTQAINDAIETSNGYTDSKVEDIVSLLDEDTLQALEDLLKALEDNGDLLSVIESKIDSHNEEPTAHGIDGIKKDIIANSNSISTINETLKGKADSNNVHTKDEITNLLAVKADKDTTYNKENEEVENLIASHNNSDTAHSDIRNNIQTINGNISAINETLANKANSSEVYKTTETYNQSEIDNLISVIPDMTEKSISDHDGDKNAHGEIQNAIKSISNSLSGKADKNHASDSTDYGLGNTNNYGHLKLSDSIKENESDATKGIAATPKAIYTVNNALTEHEGNTTDAHGIDDIWDSINDINSSISTIGEQLYSVDENIENLIPKSDINEPNGVVGLDGNGNIEINNITVSGEEKAFYFIDNEKDAIAIIDEYGLRTTRVAATTALTIGDTQLSSEDAKKLKDDVYSKTEVEELITDKLKDLTSSGEATPETILALVQSLQENINNLTAALTEQAGRIPTITLINHMIPDNSQE